MEWVPIVLITFKLVVMGIGMFLAIKWHYDQGKKKKKGGARGFLAELEREREVDE